MASETASSAAYFDMLNIVNVNVIMREKKKLADIILQTLELY